VQAAHRQGRIDGAATENLTRAILADAVADNAQRLVNDFFHRRS